nr:MORN repeat protein,putative [Plasmodium sp. DRC-Itaito]
MKHGYGIYVYDHINRYEGYWFRGMKHGYAILYEGDHIYYAHFNYDKLISKEIILLKILININLKKKHLNLRRGR